MSEEKKTYSMVGQVTIGTDEYRDLIESLADMTAEYKAEESKAWERYRKITTLEAKLKEMQVYKDYVTEKCLDSFRLWKMEKEEENA